MDTDEKIELIEDRIDSLGFATEVLKDYKSTTGKTIKRLWIALILSICIAFGTNVLWVYQWLQYDFVSSYEYKTNGIYSLIDSENNVIGTDLTADEIKAIMEVINNGERISENNSSED